MNANHTIETTETAWSSEFPTPADVELHLHQARRLRAEATADILAWAFRPVSRGARALGAWWAAHERRRETRDALMRCSDRVLADIGIAREDIPLIASGIDPHDQDARAIGWRRWWQVTRHWVDTARRIRQQRRRVYRELMAYRDHELDDLGIRRVDIPAIAGGRLPAAA